MVAEQNDPMASRTSPAKIDGRGGDEPRRQPTLAEELDQAEREAKVTKALQAVEKHGMLYNGMSSREAINTLKKTPKRAKTPSPGRVDVDGKTWAWEDGTCPRRSMKSMSAEMGRIVKSLVSRIHVLARGSTGQGTRRRSLNPKENQLRK